MTLESTKLVEFYGYNGESYNPNTGLEYLRARYYNANQGRFFQEDTYLGDITDPLTLNRYAYVKNSPLNYMDPTGHTSVCIDKVLNPLYEKLFNRMKKSAMGIAADFLENAGHGNGDSFVSLTLRSASAGIVVAVSLSESELCINPDEIQLSVASYLMGMVSESIYYGGTSLIGQNRMELLELLGAVSGTDAEFNYAMKNLDASAYYAGKELVDIAYASFGETLSSPLALLAQLVGAMGTSGGSGSFGYGPSGELVAGIELESSLALANGMAIAVSVAGVAGATGSNMQDTGNARAEENRKKAERAAKGEAEAKFKSKELLDSHYDKHKGEFGNISKDEYLKKANDLINSTGDDVLTKVRKNGDTLYYNKATNEFAVKTKDGFLRTFFKPSDGFEYFNRQ